MPKIGIIIVLYKQKHNLELLYPSLSTQNEKDFKIYLIDNNDSYDEINYSKELNKKIGLNIEYIKSPDNSGFAKGNNIGAQKAINDGCLYVFFLNNDTELEKNCIKELLDTAESDEKTGVSSPIIFYWTYDKKNNIIQEYGSKVNFSRNKIKKNFEGELFDEVENIIPKSIEVDQVSGAAAFFKAEVLKRAGLWEERYFAYGDEIDMARRIRDAGYRQRAAKDAVIWHNHKWVKDNKAGWYREYYLIERNKFLYFHKYRLYFYFIFTVLEDIIKFPWRLIWFWKMCDFKLGMFYLLGMIHGVLNKSGKPELNFDKYR